MITTNVYFGKTPQRFLRALKAGIEKYSAEHSILEDVHVGFKKLPPGAPQKDKQVIIQPIASDDGDNKFIRWQSFGISCYAKSLTDVEDLASVLEGVCSTIMGPEGIRYVEVIVSYSETENSFSTLSRNQSTLEDWRLFTVEVSFTPIQFSALA